VRRARLPTSENRALAEIDEVTLAVLRTVAELHHAETPGSTLTVLESVGHYPMLEAPKRWATALPDVLL